MALLAGKGLRPQLAVVGEGPLRDSLAARAAEAGLGAQVHFLGRQPHERVLALMKRAQLFAMPSCDEAFGLVYTEAMCRGTPCWRRQARAPRTSSSRG